MKMSRFEKILVNRPTKGMANAAVVSRQLDALGAPYIEEVLELGCGAGEVTAFLAAQRGYNVVGADIDPAQVALARSRYGAQDHLQFVVADASGLRFDAARFDLIIAQNVFHHMPRWRRAVSEIARVLRPGGHVLWLDLTPPRLLKALLIPLRARAGVYTLQDVRTAFRDVGFVEVSLRQTVPFIPIRHELILRKSSR
jgi:ubiquinone/menaquinone biosynthesis C-methylase UbiE